MFTFLLTIDSVIRFYFCRLVFVMTAMMLKKVPIYLMLILLSFACMKKESSSFTISGTVSPVKTTYVVLKKEDDIERKIATIVDTLNIDKKGNFEVSFTDEPHLYSLNFPNKKKIDIALNTGQQLQLKITGYDTDDFQASANGSIDTQELLAYEVYRQESLERLVKSVRNEIKILKKADEPDQKKIEELGKLELINYDKHLDELVDYIRNNMTSSLGLYATSIRWKGAHNLKTFDSLATSFSAKHPELTISKKISEKVRRLQQTAIGGTVAPIEMPDVSGALIPLDSIKADFILIDFWASWCGPCRREASQLIDMMNQYSRKQFDIYGVSLDDSREKWLKALDKDKRTWTNVSTLERFKTPAAYDYAVTSLPVNFLIDKNGKILAKDLHGDSLANLLQELLSKSY